MLWVRLSDEQDDPCSLWFIVALVTLAATLASSADARRVFETGIEPGLEAALEPMRRMGEPSCSSVAGTLWGVRCSGRSAD